MHHTRHTGLQRPWERLLHGAAQWWVYSQNVRSGSLLFFFFTLSIKNWISYRKGLFELVREQLYGDVFNQSACFFVVFFNGGYTTLTKKWVFFISGKKELMVQWWPSVHSEDGVGESSWAHWWVTKLLPSSCITESSSYFRTICALNMADLYQYLKSPQNNSNAVFTQCSSIKHRRSDIMIQWYTFFILVYFDVNLQWINCMSWEDQYFVKLSFTVFMSYF